MAGTPGTLGSRSGVRRPAPRPRRPDVSGLQVDDAPVALVRLDSASTITHANAASHAVFGVRSPLLAGKPLFAYISVDDHVALRLAMKRWATGDAGPQVVRVCGRGRTPVAAQLMAQPQPDGSVVLAIAPLAPGLGPAAVAAGGGAAIDLGPAFEAARDGMLVVEAQGTTIRAANPALLQLVGLGHAAVVGAPLARIAPCDEVQPWERLLAQRTAATPVVGDARLVRRVGHPAEVEVTVAGLVHRGEPLALLTVRDVSERRALLRDAAAAALRVRDAERLESVATLAGGVAHELNNVLAAIAGEADALVADAHAATLPRAESGDALGVATQQAERSGRAILLACQRGRDVTRSLLAFAQT